MGDFLACFHYVQNKFSWTSFTNPTHTFEYIVGNIIRVCRKAGEKIHSEFFYVFVLSLVCLSHRDRIDLVFNRGHGALEIIDLIQKW
ncbi:hypothetical protein DJ69_01160 [Halorubrum persicum]|uniref:Uncharacterized protein n=1 Tax=Halorubrum persicum TaxID=1383844 RepID=A0A2G1WN72_9EURY|nr:hypothetical protein DJ69_01160 [Halorubrum persicum]